jgi:hypothetical protein
MLPRTIAMLIAIAAVTLAAGETLPPDPTTSDVCALIPGDRVAEALQARLVETRLVRPGGSYARCVYTVSMGDAANPEPTAVVLWLHNAADFEELRGYQEDPWQPVEGLGDEAFITFHPDDARHDLYVLVRDVATIEVTGEDAHAVRTVASTALDRLRPSATGD